MCGIAGLLQFSGEPVDARLIERMAQALAHRGPDGQGVWVGGPIGLGHRRLAVLDLTAAGSQPMADAAGQLHITYNGEIYNFQELRRELEGMGHRFRSRSDTEVILYAYRQWGHACLERFNGMFAFALWDGRDQSLWLARDRLGVKPLFYAQGAFGFAFASEIKGLLPALPQPPQLCREALHHYLSLNYTPAPLTLFEGVRQLPAAHQLLLRGGQAQLTRYWHLPDDAAGQAPHADQALKRLLSDAVRLRLISDVEVGAFLSGGLDSSALVAWMQQHAAGRVKTFTAVFNEPSYNEGPAAAAAAKHLGTDHHEAFIAEQALALLPKLVWHSEELTADASMLALYCVAGEASRHVKVVLSGDGADELFGGYPTYLASRLSPAYARLPRWLRRGLIAPAVAALPVSAGKASLESQLRRFVAGASADAAAAHASWRTIFDEDEKHRLLQPQAVFTPTAKLYRAAVPDDHGDLVNRLLAADLSFYLPNDMLVKVDRMTMAWGLEARTPYLDYRVVEFAARLSSHIKCRSGFSPKRLLRRASREVLPPAIRRRTKAGFNLPHGQWLRENQRALLQRHLLDAPSSVVSIMDRGEVERLIGEHASGRRDRSYQLWSLLCLSLWGAAFLDGSSTAG